MANAWRGRGRDGRSPALDQREAERLPQAPLRSSHTAQPASRRLRAWFVGVSLGTRTNEGHQAMTELFIFLSGMFAGFVVFLIISVLVAMMNRPTFLR